jgi:hypothetical protein
MSAGLLRIVFWQHFSNSSELKSIRSWKYSTEYICFDEKKFSLEMVYHIRTQKNIFKNRFRSGPRNEYWRAVIRVDFEAAIRVVPDRPHSTCSSAGCCRLVLSISFYSWDDATTLHFLVMHCSCPYILHKSSIKSRPLASALATECLRNIASVSKRSTNKII